jgi:hypothetical protein
MIDVTLMVEQYGCTNMRALQKVVLFMVNLCMPKSLTVEMMKNIMLCCHISFGITYLLHCYKTNRDFLYAKVNWTTMHSMPRSKIY